MRVLVSDTSVIIDLERGAFLDHLFRLPFEFAVPDLLYRRELAGELGERLKTLGLRGEELTPAEVTRAMIVRRRRLELSVPDSFAFALAESRGWVLLTGDGGLREIALAQRLEVHGVLWLLDQFEAGGFIPLARLLGGLTAIANHPRCRLPTSEIKRRLARYAL